MTWTVMPDYDTYEEARAAFEWDLPASYNPGVDFLGKHDADAVALRLDRDGDVETFTFGALDRRSDALAGALADLGVEVGDRVGVMAPQRPETLLAHCAAWKRGAVTVPLTTLFGPDALEHRLADAGARAVVVDPSVRDTVAAVRDRCPDLEHVIELDGASGDARAFDALVADGPESFAAHDATPATPSAIMYTSGSTGPPKGVHHSHALWLGRAAAAYNFFEQGLGPDAVCWTPASWAWGGALGGLVFAGWHHGATVVGAPMGSFDPERAFRVLERHDVTHAFVPPTALRMLMGVEAPADRYDLSLSVLAAAGEPLTPEILTWADGELGVPVNEFYGQTELNLVVATCGQWFDARPGSMGKPLPGYDVTVRDVETGAEVAPGELGEIAVRPHDDRVVFDEYRGLPEKTAAKQRDGWYLTGDLAERDEAGYLWFKSRKDDLIITSGYRVGPGEVEEAILEHPDVEQAGVVGVPDETRGEIIRAYVKPATDRDEDDLRAAIRDLVRERLAKYEYPREIVFVEELPQTSTGKIRRADLRDQEQG
ncbi:MAG: acyl-CoA synthetase [Haloarculaceae archaeon]